VGRRGHLGELVRIERSHSGKKPYEWVQFS
jgi:hypothetical protein